MHTLTVPKWSTLRAGAFRASKLPRRLLCRPERKPKSLFRGLGCRLWPLDNSPCPCDAAVHCFSPTVYSPQHEITIRVHAFPSAAAAAAAAYGTEGDAVSGRLAPENSLTTQGEACLGFLLFSVFSHIAPSDYNVQSLFISANPYFNHCFFFTTKSTNVYMCTHGKLFSRLYGICYILRPEFMSRAILWGQRHMRGNICRDLWGFTWMSLQTHS